ncbi:MULTISPECIES: hypothetical protein [Kamptonema]|uniref:hypothetical protein n=1 Tax=Kamptonema TaxID=1501433 RepID=UPI0011D1CD9E|nr:MULTISPECIES: hypothetical protein [Kamptonema]
MSISRHSNHSLDTPIIIAPADLDRLIIALLVFLLVAIAICWVRRSHFIKSLHKMVEMDKIVRGK